MKVCGGLLSSAALLISITSCMGPDGEASLKYFWVYAPESLYDENPLTPDTVYNDEYFSTNPGNYYMEYTAWDGSSWWMDYEITVEAGEIFFNPGSDTWFEIALYSSGPSLYEWSYPASLHGPSDSPAPLLTQSATRLSENRSRGPIEATSEREYDFGIIRIEFGRILD